MDGAGRWQQFLHVTLPLISPTTFFVVVITTIGSFQVFDQAYVMTGGRFYPDNATNTMVGYLFQKAFVTADSDYGSGLGGGLGAVPAGLRRDHACSSPCSGAGCTMS